MLEFTKIRMKLPVLSAVEESEDSKQWGDCSQEAQEGPWGEATLQAALVPPQGHSKSCCAHIHTGWNFHEPPLHFRKQYLGFAKGKMIRFYYKHSPGTLSLLQNLKSFPATAVL